MINFIYYLAWKCWPFVLSNLLLWIYFSLMINISNHWVLHKENYPSLDVDVHIQSVEGIENNNWGRGRILLQVTTKKFCVSFLPVVLHCGEHINSYLMFQPANLLCRVLTCQPSNHMNQFLKLLSIFLLFLCLPYWLCFSWIMHNNDIRLLTVNISHVPIIRMDAYVCSWDFWRLLLMPAFPLSVIHFRYTRYSWSSRKPVTYWLVLKYFHIISINYDQLLKLFTSWRKCTFIL